VKRLAAAGTAAWLDHLRRGVLTNIRAQKSTQAALAAHLGVSPKHMSQILTGKVNGSPEMLERIAEAAGLHIAVVVGENDPVPLPAAAPRGRKPKRAAA
jgi:transcriptional regulator with XRE-family HTH domain